MKENEKHIEEIQEVVVDTIATPITNIFKLSRSLLGLSVGVIQGIEKSIVKTIKPKEKKHE